MEVHGTHGDSHNTQEPLSDGKTLLLGFRIMGVQYRNQEAYDDQGT